MTCKHIAMAFVLVSLGGITHAGTITIAAGDADTTLNEFASQTNVSVMYDYYTVVPAAPAFKTNAIRNETDPFVALSHLLAGTGLLFQWETPTAVAILVETHAPMLMPQARLSRTRAPAVIEEEHCVCARSIGGEPLGPWCRDANAYLIYAPAACGN